MRNEDLQSWNEITYETAQDTPQAVLAAYKAAVKGVAGEAFDAAVRAYRVRHPDAPLNTIRRRVAEIICFAGNYRTRSYPR